MEKQEIRTFGRRHGKKLSAHQQGLIDNLLPKLLPANNYKNTNAILEIGFGAGEHLMDLTISNPDSIIIGAEPYINGIASLLSHITENNVVKPEYKNIRIWPDDVRKLFSDINLKFSEIWVLHPDPWPKARHEKRRLLSVEFLKILVDKLDARGKIIIGTDHTDYYNWIVEQIKKTNLKTNSDKQSVIETRYQKKNMFGSEKTMYIELTI